MERGEEVRVGSEGGDGGDRGVGESGWGSGKEERWDGWYLSKFYSPIFMSRF